MKLAIKLGLGSLAFTLLLVVAAQVIKPVSTLHAQPVTYTYEIIDPDQNPQDCPPGTFDPDGTGEVLAIREEVSDEFLPTTTYYCLLPGSDYQFRSATGGNHAITVVGNTPSQGVWGTIGAGQGNQITIGNVNVFSQSIPNPTVNPEIEEGNNNPGLTPIDRPGIGGVEGEEEEPAESCESVGALGWIMCPLAGVLETVVEWIDDEIEALLVTNESFFSDEGSGNELRAIWIQMRNLAYIVLIPIMLVMVIGTALGFEVFSAYTIKKALPRMVIAVIFITLSWYICTFLVNFTNVLGAGVRGIVLTPFQNVARENTKTPSNPDGQPIQPGLKGALQAAKIISTGGSGAGDAAEAAGIGALGLVAIFSGGAAIVASIPIIMSTLASAALILGVILLILVARQMFILALLLVAPLAILAWIFPGNDKLWKLWWNGFTKLLLIFPLIMLLIGMGQVFGLITAVARGNTGGLALITAVIVIAAYLIPYAFVPFALKWAGGVFGNLAGMVNDKERGLLDRLKKGRGERRAQGWSDWKAGTGTRYGQTNRFARGLGTRVGAGVGGGKGIFGTGFTRAQRLRGKARMDQLERQNALEKIMKGEGWNGVNQDDNALHAGIFLQDMDKAAAIAAMEERLGVNEAGIDDNERGRRRAEARRSVAAWQASGLSGRAAAIAAAQQLVTTGTGYRDLQDMTRTLALASGGNASTATALAGFANSETKKVGRGDLAPSFGRLNDLVQEELGNLGQQRPSSAGYNMATVHASRGQDAVTLLRGKPTEMLNLTDALGSHLEAQFARANDTTLSQAERDSARDEVLQTAAQIEQLNQSKAYASTENQAHVNALVERTAVIRTGMPAGAAGPSSTGGNSVTGWITGDPTGQTKAQWDQLNPPARDPRDPNLPT